MNKSISSRNRWKISNITWDIKFLVVTLLFFISQTPSYSQETQPKDWEIKGTIAALEDPNPDIQTRALGMANQLKITSAFVIIAKRLDDSDPLVRRTAINQLSGVAKEYADEIAKRLDDSDQEVRIAAIHVLSETSEVAPKYAGKISKFLTENKEVRTAAVYAIGRIGEAAREYAPDIVKLLNDNDSNIRRAAIHALGNMVETSEVQVKQIAKLLNDDDHGVRKVAADLLGKLGDASKDHAGQLAKLLNDDNPEVRKAAADALSQIGKSASTHMVEIAKHLNNDDPYIRKKIVNTLGQIGEEATENIDQIANLLHDEDKEVRKSAANALQNMGKAAKIQIAKIAGNLNDRNPDVRWNAAYALGQMGEAANNHINHLAKLLKDSDPDIRSAATYALGQMGEAANKHVEQVANLLNDNVLYVRSSAITTIGQMGKAAKKHTGALIKLLEDNNRDIRNLATDALSKIGEATKEDIARIVKLLESKDGKIRDAATNTLVKMGEAARESTNQIALLLQDKRPEIRMTALTTLGSMGEIAGEHASEIIKFLNEDDQEIRRAASEALRKMKSSTQGHAGSIALLLKDTRPDIRRTATEVLGHMGETVKEYAAEVALLLKDIRFDNRRTAAFALSQMGETANTYIGDIALLLKEDQIEARRTTVRILGKMGPAAKQYVGEIAPLLKESRFLDPPSFIPNILRQIGGPQDISSILRIVDVVYFNEAIKNECRFLAHFLGGGDPDIETLLKWLGRPHTLPQNLSKDEAIKTLDLFKRVWTLSESIPRLREDLELQTAKIVKIVDWSVEDLDLLHQHLNNLEGAASTHAATLREVIGTVEKKQSYRIISIYAFGLLCVHSLIWGILLLAYPRCRWIQAVFFWSKWGRRFSGFGYVGILLTYVPILRRKLFKPFRTSLHSDAMLDKFKVTSYFEGSEVKASGSEISESIQSVFSQIQGPIVLLGESGLGKTMLLRNMVHRSKQIVVYLPANQCSEGVLKAIQNKLLGMAKDENFLEALIHIGAIDIYIDGLNEVNADTRAMVTKFINSHLRCNIIIATQPMEWSPPSTTKIYRIQPLQRNKIEEYLLLQGNEYISNKNDQNFKDYMERCRTFISTLSTEISSRKQNSMVERILSNPMDLSVVAYILSQQKIPDISDLLKQQYSIIVDDYKEKNFNREFPLKTFSEKIYSLRVIDIVGLPDDCTSEAQCMERHKMAVVRYYLNETGENVRKWHFRHDKIQDFFMVQAFLQDEKKLEKHLGDPRFRGVYLMLALELPLEEAKKLRTKLVEHAADSKDHTTSDEFVQLLRSREISQENLKSDVSP